MASADKRRKEAKRDANSTQEGKQPWLQSSIVLQGYSIPSLACGTGLLGSRNVVCVLHASYLGCTEESGNDLRRCFEHVILMYYHVVSLVYADINV